jgi:hypothetical protein
MSESNYCPVTPRIIDVLKGICGEAWDIFHLGATQSIIIRANVTMM